MRGGLKIKNVSKAFGAVTVLRDINLAVDPGEFLVLLGGSGCGKSTLLRLISGLEEDHKGRIEIAGRDVTYLDPKDRNISMVFQSYALYPHMSVFENIAFGMRIRKCDRAEIKKEVERVADTLQLGDYLKRKPAQLSGGQRQRVAIGRAMVRDPQVFLFDEPLSNLDAKLRAEMRTEIKRIHKALNATIVYVTHDQIEAMTLADKIVLLNDGGIEQIGTPEGIYMQPNTLFAAKFIGMPEINAFDATVVANADRLAVRIGETELVLTNDAVRGQVSDGQKAVLAIRPENIYINASEQHPVVSHGHRLELCELMGSETAFVLDFEGQSLRLNEQGLRNIAPGSTHSVSWDMAHAHLFNPDTGMHL